MGNKTWLGAGVLLIIGYEELIGLSFSRLCHIACASSDLGLNIEYLFLPDDSLLVLGFTVLLGFASLCSYRYIKYGKSLMGVADVVIVLATVLIPIGYNNLGPSKRISGRLSDTLDSLEPLVRCKLF